MNFSIWILKLLWQISLKWKWDCIFSKDVSWYISLSGMEPAQKWVSFHSWACLLAQWDFFYFVLFAAVSNFDPETCPSWRKIVALHTYTHTKLDYHVKSNPIFPVSSSERGSSWASLNWICLLRVNPLKAPYHDVTFDTCWVYFALAIHCCLNTFLTSSYQDLLFLHSSLSW